MQKEVTILILIDGFLQYIFNIRLKQCSFSHNPYFNRWFSAMQDVVCLIKHQPCHNPYFNRWFSAILPNEQIDTYNDYVTILILIDGFLQ